MFLTFFKQAYIILKNNTQVQNKNMQYDAFCAWFMQTFARPEAIAAGHVQYAASITGEILKFYEDYFEINYTQRTLGK